MAKQKHPWEENWSIDKALEAEGGGQGRIEFLRSRSDPEKRAALKRLKYNLQDDLQQRARMRNEVGALKILSELNAKIPAVLEENTEDYRDLTQKLYVVMEYVPGPTLAKLVKEKGPLGLDIAAEIVLELCKTVEIAHRVGIIHRDIKPDNIIVRDLDRRDIVMVDYGLSFNSNQDMKLTRPNETFRNKFLDLPENNTPSGDNQNAISDVTALCAVLYHCLTTGRPGHLLDDKGQPPHLRPGFSVAEYLKVDPRLSQLRALFNRGFEHRMNDRFQTIADFARRLESVRLDKDAGPDEDLVVLAAEETKWIAENFRPAFIRRCSQEAQRLLFALANHCSERQTHLSDFLVSAHCDPSIPHTIEAIKIAKSQAKAAGAFGGGGFGGGYLLGGGLASALPPIPHGVEIVGQSGAVVSVGLPYFDKSRVIVYIVGAQGRQCGLLQQHLIMNKQPNAFGISMHDMKAIDNWEFVTWFDGAEDWAPDAAINAADRCIARAIRDIRRELEHAN